MNNASSHELHCSPIDLRHSGEGSVFVHPEDYEAFLMSQQDAVSALKEVHRWMAFADEMKRKIDELFVDIAQWARQHPAVESVYWAPRTDDAMIAVIARDEDEEGLLHDSMAELDLDLFERYRFRLQFILFRASEAEGMDSFLDQQAARRIFGAESRSSSGRS